MIIMSTLDSETPPLKTYNQSPGMNISIPIHFKHSKFECTYLSHVGTPFRRWNVNLSRDFRKNVFTRDR